jgi:8-oxo-dGTP diphosphatase
VAGLLIIDGKIFIAQRLEGDSNPGKWEFPGGKVEDGENPKAALAREWKEEMGVDIMVHEIFGTSRFQTAYADFHLELYRVSYIGGNFQLIEHQAHSWVGADELHLYDFLGGDEPFIAKLKP